MNQDPVFQLIHHELDRQREGIELIASENFTSKAVLDAMGSCLTNKYAEGYPGKRYYGGCEVVDEVEILAQDRLKKLFGASYANVQPHSGAQANAALFLSILKPGDTIMGFNLAHGGHLSHGSPVNFSGKVYKPIFYGVEEDTGLIDMNKVEALALLHKPKLIICGASAYARDWDYARFRSIADQIGAFLLADIAHPAGLIAARLLNDPIPHCHIVTSTTHKTLRGPRGGIIMMGKDFDNPWGKTTAKGNLIPMSQIINSGVFPGMQGGPLMHVIAAKAVAFGEALEPGYSEYCKQVVRNAKAMATELQKLDFQIVSGGTENHLMLVDLRNKQISGKEADEALGLAGITVNKNLIPGDPASPMVTSGIRLGTAAMTSRGMNETHFRQVVHYIEEAIRNKNNQESLGRIKKQIRNWMSDFPLYPGE